LWLMPAPAAFKMKFKGQIRGQRQRSISLHAAVTQESELLPLSNNNGNNSE